jgi:hypothetical protein
MALDFRMSQKRSRKEKIIAPKKIHFDTLGGMAALALSSVWPTTSKETMSKRKGGRRWKRWVYGEISCYMGYLLTINQQYTPRRTWTPLKRQKCTPTELYKRDRRIRQCQCSRICDLGRIHVSTWVLCFHHHRHTNKEGKTTDRVRGLIELVALAHSQHNDLP